MLHGTITSIKERFKEGLGTVEIVVSIQDPDWSCPFGEDRDEAEETVIYKALHCGDVVLGQ